jgi:hypothetical protein
MLRRTSELSFRRFQMVALIVGIIIVVLGVAGIARWPGDFVHVLKGSVPAMLVCGGLLAVIAGITSIKDSMEAKKLEQEKQK